MQTTNLIDPENGEWTLVRRVGPSHVGIHPANDFLTGTSRYGTYGSPHSDSTFSIKFSDLEFDEFLFSTGTFSHWLICGREAAQSLTGFNTQKVIRKSHRSEVPHYAYWMMRPQNSEDPWISYGNHFEDDIGTILYGENSWHGNSNHLNLKNSQNGLNVWIRTRKNPFTEQDEQFQSCIGTLKSRNVFTISDLDFTEGEWYLVRRVSSSHRGVHPTTDFLAGNCTYGTIGGPTDDVTFSVKFDDIYFDEFMFSTGDFTHWLICKKSEPIERKGYNCEKTILKSHVNDEIHTVKWMCRENAEDPWISFKDHFHDSCGTMLYGENAWYGGGDNHHLYLKDKHNGLNVWIRAYPSRAKSARK